MNRPEGLLTSESEPSTSEKKSEGTSKKKSKDVAAKLISNELGPKLSEPKERKFLDLFKSKKNEAILPTLEDIDSPEIASEVEAPLEKLSEQEKSTIASIVHQEGLVSEANPDEAAETAVNDFYDRVISQNLEPEAAETAVLEAFDVDNPEPSEDAPDEINELSPSSDLNEFGHEDTIWLNHDDEAATKTPDKDTGFTPPPPRPTANFHDNFEPFEPHAFGDDVPRAPSPEPEVVEREVEVERNNFGPLLVTGIVGYLIGRRRGRIKTEKKLLPIQKKLEKQVKDYGEKLKFSELKIRKVVRERDSRQTIGPLKSETRLPKSESLPKTALNPETSTEKPTKKTFYETYREESKKTKGIEANPVRSEAPVPEIVIATEAIVSSQIHDRGRFPKISERSRETKPGLIQERSEESSRERTTALEIQPSKVHNLNRNELLSVSQKIKVEGTNLRKVYEAHLIGERGLRRLVTEYLRGGNVQKALRKEITERQIDFERDPFLRDLPSQTSGGGASTPTADQALSGMIERATSSFNTPSSEDLFYKSTADYDKKQKESALKQRHATDLVIVGTIAFLMVVVVSLYLIRH